MVTGNVDKEAAADCHTIAVGQYRRLTCRHCTDDAKSGVDISAIAVNYDPDRITFIVFIGFIFFVIVTIPFENLFDDFGGRFVVNLSDGYNTRIVVQFSFSPYAW